MTRRSTQRSLLAPLPPPQPAPTPRAQWDALLASLPLTDEQRVALTIAADDIAIEAAERIERAASERATSARSIATDTMLAVEHECRRAVTDLVREARERVRGGGSK